MPLAPLNISAACLLCHPLRCTLLLSLLLLSKCSFLKENSTKHRAQRCPGCCPSIQAGGLASPSQIRACLLIEAGAGAMPLSIHPYWAGASLSKATLRKLSPQALLLPAGCSFPEAPHASGKASGATGQCLAAAPHPGWGWGRRQGICRQSPASWPASGASAPAASAASNTHTSDDETHTSLLR